MILIKIILMNLCDHLILCDHFLTSCNRIVVLYFLVSNALFCVLLQCLHVTSIRDFLGTFPSPSFGRWLAITIKNLVGKVIICTLKIDMHLLQVILSGTDQNAVPGRTTTKFSYRRGLDWESHHLHFEERKVILSGADQNTVTGINAPNILKRKKRLEVGKSPSAFWRKKCTYY